ncbi:MAG: BglG family transcription antiterminator [Turicibacter sp.]
MNSRLQEILKMLLECQMLVSGEKLCVDLGVSSRTIRSDIKKLNEYLAAHGAKVSSQKAKGYVLQVLNERKFTLFLKEFNEKKVEIDLSPEGRITYIIERFLMNEVKGIEGITEADLADELYISLSSLKKDINVVKHVLMNLDLKLEKVSHKGIKICGQEACLRKAMSRYLFNSDGEQTNELFELIGMSKVSIEEMVEKVLVEFNYRLTPAATREFLVTVYLMLIRSQQQKMLSYNGIEFKTILDELEYKMTEMLCQELEKVMHITVIQDEVLFLTKSLIKCSPVRVVSQHLEGQTPSMSNLMMNAFKLINELYDIDFSNDLVLYEFLSLHLRKAINRVKYNIDIENSMLKMIKYNYPFSIELAIIVNQMVLAEEGFNLSEDDLGYIAIHFESALERKYQMMDAQTKDALVVCDMGVATTVLLKTKLEKYFKDRIRVIDIVSSYEVNQEMLSHVDLMLTTTPLKLMSEKIVQVRQLLNERDLLLIEEKLNQTHLFNQNLVNQFNEFLFFNGVKVDTREQAMNFMMQELLEEKYVTPDVSREVYKREALTSTEIGNLVAVLHVMHEEILESFISVAILDRPIMWHQEEVQLVLFIGISKEDNGLCKLYLEKLYKHIIDLDVVNRMIACQSFDEFIKVIRKF